MHKGLSFLASLQLMKYLKSFLPKGTLLDTTILFNIYIIYRSMAFMLMKFVFFNFRNYQTL